MSMRSSLGLHHSLSVQCLQCFFSNSPSGDAKAFMVSWFSIFCGSVDLFAGDDGECNRGL